MRVTVSAVVGQLAAGRAIDAVLADYPYLRREDVPVALEYAAAAVSEADERVIISSDTDFGALLARHDHEKPSFILLRHVNELTPVQQAGLLVANLDAIADELDAGAVVTFDRTRIRVRRLPIVRDS